ncbi:MAG: glucose-1-phosphate thymidylyltransferase [Armatimonadota bacterium]
MKAVLLCAGEGTRLRPLTWGRPKHLLPVGGRAVLDWVLSDLAQAGVREVITVVGPESRESRCLRQFVADGSRWGMAARYVVQPEPLGLAHALGCAREHLADERFLMYLGDDLLDRGVVAAFAEDFVRTQVPASLVVKPVADPRAFGVVVVEDGCVTGLVEKPADPPSDLAIVGVYGFGPQIWQAVDSIQPSARGELEITDAIDCLVRRGLTVTCHVTGGFWADAGSPEALLSANHHLLGLLERHIDGEVDGSSTVQGPVHIATGARVIRSRITGPCLVGPDCLLENAQVGPDVALGAQCVVRSTSITNSILDDACRIERVQPGLCGSILGANAVVCDVCANHGPLELLLADFTVIGSAGGR